MKYKGFKDAFKYYMRRKELTISDVSNVLKVTESCVNRWLRGDSSPTEFHQDLYFNILDEYSGKKYGMKFESGLYQV